VLRAAYSVGQLGRKARSRRRVAVPADSAAVPRDRQEPSRPDHPDPSTRTRPSGVRFQRATPSTCHPALRRTRQPVGDEAVSTARRNLEATTRRRDEPRAVVVTDHLGAEVLLTDSSTDGTGAMLEARTPAPGPPKPAGTRWPWPASIADDLRSTGVSIMTAYPTGRHVVDICIGDERRNLDIRCGVHPDGPDAHVDRHLALMSARMGVRRGLPVALGRSPGRAHRGSARPLEAALARSDDPRRRTTSTIRAHRRGTQPLIQEMTSVT
jgi:hypothetical protein